MRKSLTVIALVLSLAAWTQARSEDSLFSDVQVESAFGAPGQVDGNARSTRGSAQAPRRLTNAVTLIDALKQAGIEAKELTEQAVSLTITHEQWNFPAAISVTEDRSQLELVVMLSTVKDERQVPAERLLELLAANKQLAPAYFAYSAKRRQTELHRSLPNQGITGANLKTELSGLAGVAKATQSVWSFETAVAAAPAQTPATSPAATQPAAANPVAVNPVATTPPAASAPAAGSSNTATGTTVASLVGKWAASVSTKEAFAIQLGNDNKFVLAHVKDGKQTRSNGTFALSGQQLTLSGSDGTKLTGMVNLPSDQEFQFIPNSNTKGSILVFKRAK
jgi:hypothetical protein